MQKTLDRIQSGNSGTVVKINGDAYIWRRYLSFGILPGTVLTVFSHTQTGMIVKVGNTKLAFMGGSSENILCETRDTERRNEHDRSARRKPELRKIDAL
ncbi:MAG: ferrous iron transport protein A [Ruminococcus sp.]|nr:ferrous iron transport protein A [Candidatus Apopatosoma intestinale]